MAFGGTSPSNSEMDDLKEQFLFCKVCTNQYTMQERRPKLLPCTHTYCMSCIASVNPRHCPTCCQVFDLTDDDAANLPDNLTIQELMSYLKVPEKIDGESTCEKCPQGLKTASLCYPWSKEYSMCYHCRRQICKKCEECHSTMRSFVDHIVESLNSIDLSEAKAKKTYYCEVHKTKKLQKYCKDCEAVIRCVCAVNHQHHKVVDVDSVNEENYTKLNKLVDDIVSIQKRAILKSSQASRKTDMLDKNYQECIDDIDLFCTNLQSKLIDTIAHHKTKLKAEVAFKLSSIDQYKRETEEAEIFLSHIGSIYETIQPILDRKCPFEVSQALHTRRTSLQELLDRSKSMAETELGPKLAYSLLTFTPPIFYNFSAFINSTSIQTYNIVPANTEVICNNGLVGHPCRIIIRLRDRKNEPCSHYSKHMELEASVCFKTESTSRYIPHIPIQQIAKKPGEHEASFVPPVVGTYDVVVKVMGESVPSPLIMVYKLDVQCTYVNNALCTGVTLFDENNQMVSEEFGIVVDCIDPIEESIKPTEMHHGGVLKFKFDVKHLGKHLIRVMYHDILIESRCVLVKHVVMKAEKGFEIIDLAVLPSNEILFLTTSVVGIRELGRPLKYRAELLPKKNKSLCCYVGLPASNQLSIGYSIQGTPRFAVSSIEHKGCVWSLNFMKPSLTFFTQHSLSILKEHTVDLKEHIIPEAIAMTSTGNILVCTSSNIKVFLSDGSLQKTLTQDQIMKPSNMSVDFKDNVFICDSASHCVHMLNSDFEFVKIFGSGITNT
ncbi:uncharacterized protein [Antedon mediterranea]|uniref:uncharacterized protein n=1 Tax=Antedon mediterranea TaxID=105859 RepID=UPI003AF837E0